MLQNRLNYVNVYARMVEYIWRKGIKMRILYAKDAVKYIKTQDKNTKTRLKEAIEKLPLGDVKKLQGFKDEYRLRVGNLRVLFYMDDEIIIIKCILPRGQAYKRL